MIFQNCYKKLTQPSVIKNQDLMSCYPEDAFIAKNLPILRIFNSCGWEDHDECCNLLLGVNCKEVIVLFKEM